MIAPYQAAKLHALIEQVVAAKNRQQDWIRNVTCAVGADRVAAARTGGNRGKGLRFAAVLRIVHVGAGDRIAARAVEGDHARGGYDLRDVSVGVVVQGDHVPETIASL